MSSLQSLVMGGEIRRAIHQQDKTERDILHMEQLAFLRRTFCQQQRQDGSRKSLQKLLEQRQLQH